MEDLYTSINFYAGGKKLHVSFEKFQENLHCFFPGSRSVNTRFFSRQNDGQRCRDTALPLCGS